MPLVDPKDYLERLHRDDTFDVDANEDIQTGELSVSDDDAPPAGAKE